MATISNTPRPGYVWDATDNCWYPIGTGPHSHADYITSGSAINPNIVDAKGDIIAATAADTVSRLAVGSNDQVLTADSSTATGLKWATPVSGSMTVIASGSLATSGVTISSIPSTYKDLLFIVRGFTSTSGPGRIRLNSDSGSNYRLSRIEVGSSTVTAGTATTSFNMEWSDSTSTLVTMQIFIRDYATTSKSAQLFTGDVSRAINYAYHFGVYQTSSAINSINLFGDVSVAGTYVLYGVN